MSPLRFSCPATLLLFASAAIAQITPGNLVVIRVGDGAAPLGSAAAATFVEQFDRNVPGAALSSLPLPTAAAGANQPVTLQGSATSEGFVTQTADGNYILATGYAAIPGAASPNGAASATVNRVIARIDLAGNIDSSTALTDAHNAGSIRSAVSIDGTSFWTSGAGNTTAGTNRGMTYVAGLGATTSLQIPATITNGRVAAIFDGQLYVSTAAGGTFGIIGPIGVGITATRVARFSPATNSWSGMGSDTDDCTAICADAVCGDGYVHAGVEDCDDGNSDNDDECVGSCVLAVCGDGYVHIGTEQCDDANAVEDDLCKADCTANAYGDDFETGTLSFLPWVSNAPAWMTTTLQKHAGTYAAVNADIGDGGTSTMEVTLLIPAAGVVHFWHRESSEGSFDYLRYYVDGVQQGSWSGQNNWAEATYPIAAGQHTLRFSYTKDGSVSTAEDSVYVDDLLITPP